MHTRLDWTFLWFSTKCACVTVWEGCDRTTHELLPQAILAIAIDAEVQTITKAVADVQGKVKESPLHLMTDKVDT